MSEKWTRVREKLDEYGCALIGRLIEDTAAAELIGLYADDARFRATIDMGRHRFGQGEYRYFAEPLPFPKGHGLVFTTRDRPVQSARGWSAAPVRHGVSVVRSGQRFTLGLVMHDAA